MSPALRRAGVVAVLAVSLSGLGGCSTATSGDLAAQVAEITSAANQRDADAVRAAADDLLEDVDAQVAAGTLTTAEAARLTELARQVRADADLIDQDLLDAENARREAEQAAQRAAEQEAARKAAEEAARKAQEAARKAEEEARKVLEEAEKDKEKGKDKDDDEEQDDG